MPVIHAHCRNFTDMKLRERKVVAFILGAVILLFFWRGFFSIINPGLLGRHPMLFLSLVAIFFCQHLLPLPCWDCAPSRDFKKGDPGSAVF